MTMNNFKKRIIEHKIAALLLFAVILGSLAAFNPAQAALCPWDSARSVYRCYAVHNFYPSGPLYSNGLKSTNIVIDRTVDNQFVLSSTWAKLTNGNFFEVAWKDNQYSTSHPYFTCAANGATITTWGTPGNNTSWTFRVHDQDKNQIWSMEVDASGTPASCIGNGAGILSNNLKTGYETPYDNNNISKNDYSNLQFVRDNIWYLWQSFYGTHGKVADPPTIFYVHGCGTTWTNDPSYWHSQHGKGTEPSSCT